MQRRGQGRGRKGREGAGEEGKGEEGKGRGGEERKRNSLKLTLVSEREPTFTFAICHWPSVCLSVVDFVCRLSVCLPVTFVRSTQAIEIFGNVSTPFGHLLTSR